MAGGQIVVNHDVVSMTLQSPSCMTPNVPSTTDDEDNQLAPALSGKSVLQNKSKFLNGITI